jgi:hypothetical protein
LRRPSDPFIGERPVAIATDELEHHAGFHIDPFVPPFRSTAPIGLDFVQLCRTLDGSGVTNQYATVFSRKGGLHRQHMVRIKRGDQ